MGPLRKPYQGCMCRSRRCTFKAPKSEGPVQTQHCPGDGFYFLSNRKSCESRNKWHVTFPQDTVFTQIPGHLSLAVLTGEQGNWGHAALGYVMRGPRLCYLPPYVASVPAISAWQQAFMSGIQCARFNSFYFKAVCSTVFTEQLISETR